MRLMRHVRREGLGNGRQNVRDLLRQNTLNFLSLKRLYRSASDENPVSRAPRQRGRDPAPISASSSAFKAESSKVRWVSAALIFWEERLRPCLRREKKLAMCPDLRHDGLIVKGDKPDGDDLPALRLVRGDIDGREMRERPTPSFSIRISVSCPIRRDQ